MTKTKTKISYISVKAVSGETFSGEFLGYKTEPKSGLEMASDGWAYFFPLESLAWWAIGSKSSSQIEQERAAKLKAEAKKVLAQFTAPVRASVEPEPITSLVRDNVEQPPASSEEIAPPLPPKVSLRSIALHQQQLPNFTRSDLRPRAKRVQTLDS